MYNAILNYSKENNISTYDTKSKDKINTNQTNNVKVDMVYRIYIK